MFERISAWICMLLNLKVAPEDPKLEEASFHTPYSTLPIEITQLIAPLLPVSSAASFALCDRFTFMAIGSRYWHYLRDPAHCAEKKTFLSTIERDHPNFVYCHHCNELHCRELHELPCNQSGWAMFNPIKRCIERDRIQFMWVGSYFLYFRLCQLVMRAHRYGPQYGIPLDALSHRYSESREQSASQVFISARIAPATGELIVRIKFRILIDNNKDLADLQWHWVQICHHLVGMVNQGRLASLWQCRLSHVDGGTCTTCSGLIQCYYCATECLLETEDFRDLGLVVTITGWKNLGSCETPADPKWIDQGNGLERRGSINQTVYHTRPGSIHASFEHPESLHAIPRSPFIYKHKFW